MPIGLALGKKPVIVLVNSILGYCPFGFGVWVVILPGFSLEFGRAEHRLCFVFFFSMCSKSSAPLQSISGRCSSISSALLTSSFLVLSLVSSLAEMALLFMVRWCLSACWPAAWTCVMAPRLCHCEFGIVSRPLGVASDLASLLVT